MPTTRSSASGPNARPAQTQSVVLDLPATGSVDLDPEGTGLIGITDTVRLTVTGSVNLQTIAPGAKDGQELTVTWTGGNLNIVLGQATPVFTPLLFAGNVPAPASYGAAANSALTFLYNKPANVWQLKSPHSYTT